MNKVISGNDPTIHVGTQLRKFRQENGYSLAQLAQLTGISDATLSRVENAQTLVSAHNLYVLSKALNVDITAFYEPSASPMRSGIRSVSRQGAGRHIETAQFVSSVLGADLANKKMHPAIDEIKATSLDNVGGLSSHTGEEFIYVLKGTLILHTEHYAPLSLNAGDSIYFDGSMPHAYLCADGTFARILVITSSEQGLDL